MSEFSDGDYYRVAEVDAEMVALKRDAERGNRAMRALERLTPQGSEFHNDPEFCAKYIREAWDNDRALMKEMALKRNRMREEMARLRAVMSEYASHCSWRCYSDYYPTECCCGLDSDLIAVGMDDVRVELAKRMRAAADRVNGIGDTDA